MANPGISGFDPVVLSAASPLNLFVNGGFAYINGVGTSVPTVVGLAMTASATNFVFVDTNLGTIQTNTAGYPANSIPICQVVTNAQTITSVVDQRTPWETGLSTVGSLGAQTALATITTAQTAGTFNIPLGFLNSIGKTLRVRAWGIFSQGAAASVPTFSLLINGVTPWTITTASSSNAITNGQWEVEAYLRTAAIGATGTIESHGVALCQASGTLTTAIPVVADQNTAVSAAINLLTATNIQLQIAVATNAWTSAQLRLGTIEVLN